MPKTRTQIAAFVEIDSVSPSGKRLTTFVAEYPRFIHSELMTHRVFSRSAASSRAIPIKKMLDRVYRDPVVPVRWGAHLPGMNVGKELAPWRKFLCRHLWLKARFPVLITVFLLAKLGLAKSIANRLLEPWAWITTVITATEWDNFYNLRRAVNAQPEIKVLADKMFEAQKASKPKLLYFGEWHLPFIRPADRIGISQEDLIKCSVARAARTSYLNHYGTVDICKDLSLFRNLLADGHVAPLEHACTPLETASERSGNLIGWKSFRKTIPGEDVFIPKS